jgi:hypothetical protein
MSDYDPVAPQQGSLSRQDWIRLTDEVKARTEDVTLHAGFWSRYGAGHGLRWQKVPFTPESRPQVPRKAGLYAFAVQPPHADFPPSTYLFYIGEVGATSSTDRTLWQRFKEYLDELKVTKRPSVGMFLNRYNGYIDFYFCELDPQAVDIKAIESALITALWPKANIRDYAVGVRQVRQAFS